MDLKNKKIGVLGIGREGQALARYFVKEKIEADFLDENTEADTSPIKQSGFNVVKGNNALDNLNKYDIVFRSPGISPNHPKLSKIKNKLTSLTKLFFELWPGKIIGVTGTKGKGTTSSIIKSILNEAKVDSVLVGNIGEVSLDEINVHSKNSFAVIELSSFQLMNLGVSPHIAVVLDTTVEHLDYHKSINEYLSAKLEIVKYQKLDDWLVITGMNPNYKKFSSIAKAKIVEAYGDKLEDPTEKAVWWQSGEMRTNVHRQESIIKSQEMPLIGEHNRINSAAAVATALIININMDSIRKALIQFKNLSQRLESIGQYGGIEFINDSASTNPSTTIAAIKSFEKPITLIIGGKNKGLDYTDLLNTICKSNNVKTTIVFGSLKDQLKNIADWKKNNIIFVETLNNAVDSAIEKSKEGDVVLFSPGAASFDQFANYNQRGQKFNNLIHEHFTE